MHESASSALGLKAMVAVGCAMLTTLAPLAADAFERTPASGIEGEIDINVQFDAHLGQVRPTQRQNTWQGANIKELSGGIGYTLGSFGPLYDAHVHLKGAYFSAAPESVERDDDVLAPDTSFFDQDRGGYLTATIAANVVKTRRVAFGVFAQGTVPMDVDLQKLSNVHLHFATGGVTLGISATEPGALFRFALRSQLSVGTGMYLEEFQHNAAISLSNLVVVELARSQRGRPSAGDTWVLPWRLGVSFGPYFEADLNAHTNEVYRAAYASVGQHALADQELRAIRVALAVLPYLHITDHAMVQLGLVHTVSGSFLPATQLWSGGLRVAF